MSQTKRRKQYCYDFPRPALTVDVILFRRGREVLLVKRAGEPFAGMWAFPGGFVNESEPLEAAAHRELQEETGLRGTALAQLGAFGDPGRDPRGHTVTIAFVGSFAKSPHTHPSSDASEVRWFPVDQPPELAFDHAKILKAAVRRIRSRENI